MNPICQGTLSATYLCRDTISRFTEIGKCWPPLTNADTDTWWEGGSICRGIESGISNALASTIVRFLNEVISSIFLPSRWWLWECKLQQHINNKLIPFLYSAITFVLRCNCVIQDKTLQIMLNVFRCKQAPSITEARIIPCLKLVICLLDKVQTLGLNNFITLHGPSILTTQLWQVLAVPQACLIYKRQFMSIETVEERF